MAGKRLSTIPTEFAQVRLIQEPYQFLGARETEMDTYWHVPGGAILSRTEIESRIGPCRLESVPVTYTQEDRIEAVRRRPHYTAAQEQSVRELVAAKCTHAEIGWALGRSEKSVAEFCRKAKITRKGA